MVNSLKIRKISSYTSSVPGTNLLITCTMKYHFCNRRLNLKNYQMMLN